MRRGSWPLEAVNFKFLVIDDRVDWIHGCIRRAFGIAMHERVAFHFLFAWPSLIFFFKF